MQSKIVADRSSYAFWVALIVASIQAARIGFLASLVDGKLVQNIPDDAFYYLQAARNFARIHQWSFDGTEPSSGFHLLWGYFLAACFKADPTVSLRGLFLAGSLLQAACLSLAAFLVTRTAERFAGLHAAGGVLLVFLSAISLLQATSMMETCLVVLAAAATLDLLARLDLRLTPVIIALSFLLGVLVSLSRSDAGLLVFFFTAAHLYCWLRGQTSRAMLLTSVTALAGVISGFGVVSLNTHWVSGQWVQASAQQKVFWTRVVGPSSGGPAHLASNVLNPLYNAVAPYTSTQRFLDRHLHPVHHIYPAVAAWIAFCSLAIAAGLFLWLRSHQASGHRTLIVVPVATIAGYVFVYRYVSAAIRAWYISNFQVPLAILTGIGLAWFLHNYFKSTASILALLCSSGVLCSFVAPSPWAEAMWRAGVYLRDHPGDRPVGAWNAGILSYFSGGEVVNLDGLMNDRILPYAQRGDLKSYLAQRQIRFIFDSPQMWNANSSALGGYGNGELQHCIQTGQDLFPDDPNNIFGDDHIRLYTLDPACLGSGRTR